jgi:hypothetical protein
MISAPEGLDRLLDGNQRFISGVRSVETVLNHKKRAI